MGVLRGAIVLAATASVACVLFVDAPGDLGTTCSFAGRATTTCGRCISQSCQAVVDACCGDVSCRGALPALDACSSGESCSTLTHASAATKLGACVRESCSAACADTGGPSDGGGVGGERDGSRDASRDAADASPPPPPPRTFCFATAKDSCECTVAGAGERTTTDHCDATVVTNAHCCADDRFPDVGTSCKCLRVGCTGDGGQGCLCGPSVNVDLTCSTECCLSADAFTCRCRGSCFNGEKGVPSCKTPSIYACARGKKRVTACHD